MNKKIYKSNNSRPLKKIVPNNKSFSMIILNQILSKMLAHNKLQLQKKIRKISMQLKEHCI